MGRALEGVVRDMCSQVVVRWPRKGMSLMCQKWKCDFCILFSASTSLLYPFSYTCSVVNKKLKFIRGLIEHTESRTIHIYIYAYRKFSTNSLVYVGLAQARPNY